MTIASHIRILALPALLAGLSGAAFAAGSTSSQFNVTATVMSACTLAATDLAFGNYSASAATPTDVSNNLTLTCTSGLPYTISLDGGTTSANVAARNMTDGASHSLKYFLYTTAARTTLWGDGTVGTSTLAGTGNGASQSLSVYGRIPGAQFVAAGAYSDRITVTVNY